MNRDDNDGREAQGGTASAYATGGGGTVFEHTYGATLLAALLLGDSVPGLGDEQSVTRVVFQARRFTAVDDFLVFGEPRGTGSRGGGRELSIGVRHKPRIAPSDKSFVSLLITYLRVIEKEWDRVKDGEVRLGLVVGAPHGGARELAALAEIARTQPTNEEFRSFVATPRATRKPVRKRLNYLDDAVEEASRDAGVELPDGGARELAWRLLVGLHPIEVRLEGGDAADRTGAVSRLRSLVGETSEADTLFSKLARLASNYASTGAVVDEAVVRRDLQGVARVGRSPTHTKAWDILAQLDKRLGQRIGRELAGQGQQLTLERSAVREKVIAAMGKTGRESGALVITGDPDVGKSALTLSAVDALTSQDQEVVALSLRDLPRSVVDLSTLLGAPLQVVLGSLGVSKVRLLVVDGAEAALEDRFEVLAEMGEAARHTRIGLVAVTRSDGRGQVVEAVSGRAPGSEGPSEMNVDGLTAEEIRQVVAVFPAMRGIAEEPRAVWLLERPGLVDLLLRADALAALPDGALSEADVFAAVWSGLVRRSERNEPGRGSPDGRECALIDVARRQIGGEAGASVAADPAALPSLRSDGLLLASGPTAAWSAGDQFATDLIRDFAVARLFLVDGWLPLHDAGAPRWALRAARLACQARFARPGAPKEQVRVELQQELDSVAAEHGERWRDVPLEALLSLGSPRGALEEAWPALAGEGSEGLKRLLRLVLQRYTDGLSADPVVTQPIVELMLDHEGDISELSGDIRESADEIEVRWLRGLALKGDRDAANPLRARIRDRLLASGPRRHDEREHECLALLGPDLDVATEVYLRELAGEAPGFLGPCVEPLAASTSMACHRPDLLLDLAEAYYVVKREEEDLYYSYHDQGIRNHHHRGGWGTRMVAWWYGPFWSLLRKAPRQTIVFVNRLLDHAARARMRRLGVLESGNAYYVERSKEDEDLPGVELELPGVGIRRLVGDSHAWGWYRGSTVGPYPCMSALLAVERFVDQAHGFGVELRVLAARLLRECHNLAMPGLVVGFLIRHLDEVTDELDGWLAEPAVWELEFGRSSSEGHLHVQGPDADDVRGRSNRGMSLRDVATELTLRAVLASDDGSIGRLRSVADKLIERASAFYGPDGLTPGFEERMTTARNWASHLRAESYEIVNLEGGRVGIQYTPPEVSREFAAQQVDLNRGMQIMRLLNYATRPGRDPGNVSNLGSDLKLAVELSDQPPETGQEFARDAIPAVAATAIVAFTEERFRPGRKELEWASGIILQAAMGTSDSESMDPSFYQMGGDRSAAAAVPCLLLPAFNENGPSWLDDEHLKLVDNALLRLLTSGSEEVRRRTAKALGRVWSAPCTPGVGASGKCRHTMAWEAVEASVRDCRMGPFDSEAQRRQIALIDDPIEDVMEAVDPQDMLIGRLVAPLIASSMCASSTCCVCEEAGRLRDVVLRAHARGAVHWVGEQFELDRDPEVQEAIAECLLRIADNGDVKALGDYAEMLAEEPIAFRLFVEELARVATYDPQLRRAFRLVWPTVMARLLARVESDQSFLAGKRRHRAGDRDEALACLLPRPRIRLNEMDIEATLRQTRGEWLELAVMEPLIVRWLRVAAGIPHSVDNMVGFLGTLPPAVGMSQKLDMMVAVVNEGFQRIASRTWYLCEWLEELNAGHVLEGLELSKFQLLVDGLAAHGDPRAVRLQKALE